MSKMECDVKASLDNIKRLLGEQNISNAQLAREIGGNTTRHDVHKILNHRKVMPKLDWLIAISEVLNVPLQELIILKPREDI